MSDHLVEKYIKTKSKDLRDELIENNRYLIYHVMKRYKNIPLELGVNTEELFQIGIIGLIEGVESFDGKKEFKFHIYNEIRNSIFNTLRELDKTIFGVSDRGYRYKRMIQKAKDEFLIQYDREPSEKELAKKLGWTIKQMKSRINLSSNKNIIALDSPVMKENEDSFYELIEDKTARIPENEYEKEELSKELKEVLSELPPKEREIIYLNIIKGIDCVTIGKRFGVSQSSILRTKDKALEKMKVKMTTGIMPKKENTTGTRSKESITYKVTYMVSLPKDDPKRKEHLKLIQEEFGKPKTSKLFNQQRARGYISYDTDRVKAILTEQGNAKWREMQEKDFLYT